MVFPDRADALPVPDAGYFVVSAGRFPEERRLSANPGK